MYDLYGLLIGRRFECQVQQSNKHNYSQLQPTTREERVTACSPSSAWQCVLLSDDYCFGFPCMFSFIIRASERASRTPAGLWFMHVRQR